MTASSLPRASVRVAAIAGASLLAAAPNASAASPRYPPEPYGAVSGTYTITGTEHFRGGDPPISSDRQVALTYRVLGRMRAPEEAASWMEGSLPHFPDWVADRVRRGESRTGLLGKGTESQMRAAYGYVLRARLVDARISWTYDRQCLDQGTTVRQAETVTAITQDHAMLDVAAPEVNRPAHKGLADIDLAWVKENYSPFRRAIFGGGDVAVRQTGSDCPVTDDAGNTTTPSIDTTTDEAVTHVMGGALAISVVDSHHELPAKLESDDTVVVRGSFPLHDFDDEGSQTSGSITVDLRFAPPLLSNHASCTIPRRAIYPSVAAARAALQRAGFAPGEPAERGTRKGERVILRQEGSRTSPCGVHLGTRKLPRILRFRRGG